MSIKQLRLYVPGDLENHFKELNLKINANRLSYCFPANQLCCLLLGLSGALTPERHIGHWTWPKVIACG
jgi:hypothetical protein